MFRRVFIACPRRGSPYTVSNTIPPTISHFTWLVRKHQIYDIVQYSTYTYSNLIDYGSKNRSMLFSDQVSMRNNVSTRVATEMLKFRRTPAQTLRTGRYTTANLRKNDGFINFRYRPQENATTEFHVLPCGGGIVRAKLRGPGIVRVCMRTHFFSELSPARVYQYKHMHTAE